MRKFATVLTNFGCGIYGMILVVIFLIKLIGILFVLPHYFLNGYYSYDHSPYGRGRKRTVWEQVKAVYNYQLRLDAVWESLHDDDYEG
jgi:hypothetical protein